MSMANSVQIRYRGEVLCCLDQTEVKMVEPFRFRKDPPQNLWKRICGWTVQFLTGKRKDNPEVDFEDWTKISFKDGSWTRIKMPFLEFVNGYC
jgi:hypothetical protein